MGIQINGQTDTITAVDGSFTLGGSVTANVTTTSGTLTVGTGATVHSPASNTLTLGTNSVERVRIDSSGRFGIGTNTLSRDLVLYKSSAPAFHIQNSTSGTGSFDGLGIQLVGADAGLWNYENGYLRFGTNDLERLRITSAGNVGIGTNSTGDKLRVNGTSRFEDYLRGNSNSNKLYISDDVAITATKKLYFDGGSNTYIDEVSADVLRFTTGTTERLRIDSSGRLLLGYNTLADNDNKFEITNAAGAGIGFLRNDTTTVADDNIGKLSFYGNDSNGIYQTVARIEVNADDDHATGDKPGRFSFFLSPDGGNSPVERLRITSSGDVGIGTDNPGTLTWRTGQTLDVFAGSGNATGQLYLGSNRGDGSQSVGSIIFYDNTQTASHQNVAIIEVDKAGSGTNTRGGDILFYNKVDGGTSTPVTFKIRSGGNCEIPDGNLVFASGHGIDFSATTDATGMTSELFDDYEEGTFTPTLRGSTTAGTATGTIRGRYIKIGHFVHCSIRVNNVNFSGSAGDIMIDNLPYNIATAANSEYSMAAAAMVYNVSFNTSYMHGWFLNPGTSRAFGIVSRSGLTWTDWPSSEFHSSSIYMNQTLTYMAA